MSMVTESPVVENISSERFAALHTIFSVCLTALKHVPRVMETDGFDEKWRAWRRDMMGELRYMMEKVKDPPTLSDGQRQEMRKAYETVEETITALLEGKVK